MFVFNYQFYFVHYGGSNFLLMRVLGIIFCGSNEPTLHLKILANQFYPVALEQYFILDFLITFAIKLSIIPIYTWLLDTYGEVIAVLVCF